MRYQIKRKIGFILVIAMLIVMIYPGETGVAADSSASFVINDSGELTQYIGKENAVTIPDEVTKIGDTAFQGLEITSVEIPDRVTEIGEGAFADCAYLTTVNIPAGVTSVGDRVFYGCTSLESVVWQSSAGIPDNAFTDCVGLTDLRLSQEIPSIGGEAFKNCESLKSFAVPAATKEIAAMAFDGCKNMAAISVDSANAYYTSYDNVLYTINGVALYRCPQGAKSITIHDGTKVIRKDAFYGCNLVKVVLPESVTTVEDGAFEGCEIQTLVLGASVTDFGIQDTSSKVHLIEVPENSPIAEELVERYNDTEDNEITRVVIGKKPEETEPTEEPDDTEQPDDTEKPDDTETPGNTEDPGSTETPGNTEDPGSTGTPGNTEDPGSTETPGNTEDPGSTGTPGNTEDPGSTETPGNTEDPGSTGTPGNTGETETIEKTVDKQRKSVGVLESEANQEDQSKWLEDKSGEIEEKAADKDSKNNSSENSNNGNNGTGGTTGNGSTGTNGNSGSTGSGSTGTNGNSGTSGNSGTAGTGNTGNTKNNGSTGSTGNTKTTGNSGSTGNNKNSGNTKNNGSTANSQNTDTGSANANTESGSANTQGSPNEAGAETVAANNDSGTGLQTESEGTAYILGKSEEKGWSNIYNEMQAANNGETITICMNGTTVVPAQILALAKEKDLTLILDMGNDIRWRVAGEDIMSEGLTDVDFGVALGSGNVPQSLQADVADQSWSTQLHLAYDGIFGLTADLTVNIGAANAGRNATLFYYNEAEQQLEYVGRKFVGEKGEVTYTFAHASDYVIVVDGLASAKMATTASNEAIKLNDNTAAGGMQSNNTDKEGTWNKTSQNSNTQDTGAQSNIAQNSDTQEGAQEQTAQSNHTQSSGTQVKDDTPKTGQGLNAKYILCLGVMLMGIYMILTSKKPEAQKAS